MDWKVVNQKYVTHLPDNLARALATATDLAASQHCNVFIRDDAAHGIIITFNHNPRRGSHLMGVVTPSGQAIWITSEIENRGAVYEPLRSLPQRRLSACGKQHPSDHV